jgi:hypothetical protein
MQHHPLWPHSYGLSQPVLRYRCLYCHVLVARHGVWIGNWIYWRLTTYYLRQVIITVLLIHYTAHAKTSTAFNNGNFIASHAWARGRLSHNNLRLGLTGIQTVTLRPTVSRPVNLGVKHPSENQEQIFIIVRHLRVCWCGAPSLKRERVCLLQLLLALASTVILGSESRGTHDHILLSQIRDYTKLEDQVPVFISPRNRVAQLYHHCLQTLLT